jgi:hypothetical protein
MYHDMICFVGEALEHSVFADDTGETLRAVRNWMRQYIPRSVL